MRPISGTVLTTILLAASWSTAQEPPATPHSDPSTGVLRVLTVPSTRGECEQCHATHGEEWGGGPYRFELFSDNTNQIPFWRQGDGPCHPDRADNYPLREEDRLPEGIADAGYFEANIGGLRRVGPRLRGRWPGERVYSDPQMTASGRHVSPHAHDADMPRRDPHGQGLCLNCHNPHGTPNPFDMLVAPYRGIGGHDAVGAPTQYQLCFDCHGRAGPAGMDPANKLLEDFYDAGLNGDNAGHQIRMENDVALSWPAHIRRGDQLPCYDCHNPHGSEGNDRIRPNGFLISDQRAGWSDLTDTLNDAAQARAFCFGCHIPADGVPGSQQIEGIVMNILPNEDAHLSTDARSCYDCHGRDYSNPRANNVHNPGDGDDDLGTGRLRGNEWNR